MWCLVWGGGVRSLVLPQIVINQKVHQIDLRKFHCESIISKKWW